MELLRLKTADVRPNGKNPRTDFSSVERLAENLAATGGEPVNPIVVMRDGSGYRILDGERRWRAMEKNGQKECNAVVCDGWDDADQVLAALSSDDKEPLSDLERSRGLQEFMDLGVSDDKVSAAETVSGVKAGTVRRIRRVRDRAGDRAANMTIDQLLAAAEFEDDPDAVERVLSSDSWEYEASRIKSERRRDDKVSKMVGVLGMFGVTRLDEVPDGLKTVYSSTDPDRLKDWLSENGSEGVSGGYVATGWFEGAQCSLYGERGQEVTEEDLKRERAREIDAEAKELRASIFARAIVFVAERAALGVATDLCEATDDIGSYQVQKCLAELSTLGFDVKTLGSTWAHSFSCLYSAFSRRGMHWIQSDVDVDQCHRVVDTIDALVREGFQATDGDKRLAEIAQSLLDEDQNVRSAEDGE